MTSICFLGEQYLMIYRPASEMDASDQCVQWWFRVAREPTKHPV